MQDSYRRDLSKFDRDNFPNFLKIALWFLVKNTLWKFFFPGFVRIFILRLFGSKIGTNIKIRRGVNVHFPWNLIIGNNTWVGEEVWFINHEVVEIGSNVCISQRSIVCSGSHDIFSASLAYDHKPIHIKDGSWICLDAKILPGVTIGEGSIVSAGEIARKDIPDYSILISGEIRNINPPTRP